MKARVENIVKAYVVSETKLLDGNRKITYNEIKDSTVGQMNKQVN